MDDFTENLVGCLQALYCLAVWFGICVVFMCFGLLLLWIGEKFWELLP